MRAGLAIRQERALAAAYARPCPSCGHPMGEHRELRPTVLLGFDPERGPLEEPNPAYEPLHFHCHRDGCDCIHVATV